MATTEYYAPSAPHLDRRPSVDSTVAPSIASTFRIAPSTITPTRTRTADPDGASLYAPSTAASRTILGDEPASTRGGPGSFLRGILKSKLRRGNPARLFEAPGDRGLSLLHRAVQRGDLESVKELIQGGANVNARRSKLVNGYEETYVQAFIFLKSTDSVPRDVESSRSTKKSRTDD